MLRLDSEQYQHSPVTGLGDAAVFYRNTRGPGSTVWFRRADFKVWISPSSSVTNWEQDVKLQLLAVQMDQRMVLMTGDSHSGHSFPVELTLSRYPDRPSLEKRWRELSANFDITKPVITAVGESVAWVQTAQAKADRPEGRGFVHTRILVFRQGLFTGWLEGVAELGEQPLLDLAKATVERMASAR